MEHRKWTSKQKFQIVLECLRGKIEMSKLCTKHEISQTQYYKWRDQFLQTCHLAFETKNINKKEQKLENEINKLKNIVGDLAVELKKGGPVTPVMRIKITKSAPEKPGHLRKRELHVHAQDYEFVTNGQSLALILEYCLLLFVIYRGTYFS